VPERDQFKDPLYAAPWPDAENARKRLDKDRREAENYGGSSWPATMLPVYDNMKRALKPHGRARTFSGPLLEGQRADDGELLEACFKKHAWKVLHLKWREILIPQHHLAMFAGPRAGYQSRRIIQVARKVSCCTTVLLRPGGFGVSSTPAGKRRDRAPFGEDLIHLEMRRRSVFGASLFVHPFECCHVERAHRE